MSETVTAIDPGPVRSAVVLWDGARVCGHEFLPNDELLCLLRRRGGPADGTVLAVEMIASYGMAVGRETFETCLWIGRFIEAWNGPFALVYRADVKLHLCQSMRAKDPNVRQALLDRVGPAGTKKQPGATYGVTGDMWSALAVAVTYAETRG